MWVPHTEVLFPDAKLLPHKLGFGEFGSKLWQIPLASCTRTCKSAQNAMQFAHMGPFEMG